MPVLPAEHYVPVSEREFLRFSLEGDAPESRLRFERGDAGEVLVLVTPAGEVRATKER
jgi:hypothetical protein